MSIKEAIDCLALLDPAKAEEARKELDNYIDTVSKAAENMAELRKFQFEKAAADSARDNQFWEDTYKRRNGR